MSKRIMIIDDDSVFLEAARRACEKLETVESVLQARDGAEALQAIGEQMNGDGELPDVMFVDINMPVMNGFEFLGAFQRLREEHPALLGVRQVVMLTSSEQVEDRERAKSLGADEYLVKPAGLAELREALGRFVQ